MQLGSLAGTFGRRHDLAIVRDLGFRYAQGYYLSRPTSGFGPVAAAAGAGGAG